MDEKWRPVKDFEEYLVSNLGNVKRLDNLIKPVKTKAGYLQITLCKSSKRYTRFRHRLVAQAFIKNEYNKPFVNHIDSDKTNNRSDNLEWCTQKENIIHSILQGNRIPSIQTNRVINTEQKVKKLLYMIETKVPLNEIAKYFNTSRQTINNTLKKLGN